MEKFSGQWNCSKPGNVRGTLPECARPRAQQCDTELGFRRSRLLDPLAESLRPRTGALQSAMTLVFLFTFSLSAANFTASLDRETISLGESATLKLRFEGAQPETM